MAHKFTEQFLKTYVLFTGEKSLKVVRLDGPRQNAHFVVSSDQIIPQDVFGNIKEWSVKSSDSITPGDDTFNRVTLEATIRFTHTLNVQEAFNKINKLAFRRSTVQEILTKETFSKTFFPVWRRFEDTVITVQEVFSKEHVGVFGRSSSDQVTISEDFSSRLIQVVNLSSSDTIIPDEATSQLVATIISKASVDTLTVQESQSRTHEQLSTPGNVSVTHEADGSNEITWSCATDPDHFDIEYSIGGGFAPVTEVAGNLRNYNHAGCASFYSNNDNVTYRIRSVSASGAFTAWVESNMVTITNC